VISRSLSQISVLLADLDGNPLPADAALSAEVIAPTGNKCSATLLGGQIGSSIEPTVQVATLKDCTGGGIETVRFKVAVTAGSSTKTSALDVTVP
jgi:hypothetical protein